MQALKPGFECDARRMETTPARALELGRPGL
jgi:hypothetical protein